MDNAPLAIFAYNRADNLKKTLKALEECNGFSDSPIIFFIDGPKNSADQVKIDKVQKFVESLKWPNIVQINIRDQNLGLKQSIFTGVSDVCAKYGRAIVLEDDLVLSPVALEYFNEGLKRYNDDERVWSIVGYQYDTPALRNLDRALILPFTHCWGWATWDRAWKQFDLNAPVRKQDLESKVFRKSFDVHGIQAFSDMLELALSGKINSWFIRWNYKVFSEHGVSLFPPASYISNIGLQSGGTHASNLNPYSLLVNPSLPSNKLVKFPDNFSVDHWAIDKIKASWDARVQKLIAVLGSIKRKIKG